MKIIGFLVILALIAGGVYLSGNKVDVQNAATTDAEVSVDSYTGTVAEEVSTPSMDVDADVTGGAVPDVNVTTPDVTIETEAKTIEVPTGADVNAAVGSAIDDAKTAVDDANKAIDGATSAIDDAAKAVVKEVK